MLQTLSQFQCLVVAELLKQKRSNVRLCLKYGAQEKTRTSTVLPPLGPDNGNPIGQVTADGSGNWSFTPGTPLSNGTVVNAVAQDAAGNTSGPASTTVDSVAPAAPVIDPSNGSVIAGTAEAGATVILNRVAVAVGQGHGSARLGGAAERAAVARVEHRSRRGLRVHGDAGARAAIAGGVLGHHVDHGAVGDRRGRGVGPVAAAGRKGSQSASSSSNSTTSNARFPSPTTKVNFRSL